MGIMTGGVLTLLLLSTFILFAITVFREGQIIEAAMALIVGIVVLGALVIFLKNQYTSVKKGFPLHDERSNKVMVLAGNKAFLISIWWILFIGWASSNEWIQLRDISQATGVGILGMAVIFGLCALYYSKRSNLE